MGWGMLACQVTPVQVQTRDSAAQGQPSIDSWSEGLHKSFHCCSNLTLQAQLHKHQGRAAGGRRLTLMSSSVTLKSRLLMNLRGAQAAAAPSQVKQVN
jgi:hypothetical protein